MGNLIRSEDTIEAALIKRQAAMKDLETNSVVSSIRIALAKYKLPTIYELLDNPPDSEKWKSAVKSATQRFWTAHLVDEAKKKSSLKYLNIDSCRVGTPHPIWATTSLNTRDVTRATVKAKLLTGTYTLQCHRAKYNKNVSPTCQLCSSECENREHFLVSCTALATIRTPYILELQNLIMENNHIDVWSRISNNTRNMTQLILDPSSPSLEMAQNNMHNLEHCTKRLCFALHCGRSAMLGTPPTNNRPMSKIL
jgi:hypothetical protein